LQPVHDDLAQLAQDELLEPLAEPLLVKPNTDKRRLTFRLPHSGQHTEFISLFFMIKSSNLRPHLTQLNSMIGMIYLSSLYKKACECQYHPA
jgi:hypothetical protein